MGDLRLIVSKRNDQAPAFSNAPTFIVVYNVFALEGGPAPLNSGCKTLEIQLTAGFVI